MELVQHTQGVQDTRWPASHPANSICRPLVQALYQHAVKDCMTTKLPQLGQLLADNSAADGSVWLLLASTNKCIYSSMRLGLLASPFQRS